MKQYNLLDIFYSNILMFNNSLLYYLICQNAAKAAFNNVILRFISYKIKMPAVIV